jgi:hypothetical protein
MRTIQKGQKRAIIALAIVAAFSLFFAIYLKYFNAKFG